MSRGRGPGEQRAARILMLLLVLTLAALMAVPELASAATPNRSTMDVRASYQARATLIWSKGQIDVWSKATIRNTSVHGNKRIDSNLVPARIGNLRDLHV